MLGSLVNRVAQSSSRKPFLVSLPCWSVCNRNRLAYVGISHGRFIRGVQWLIADNAGTTRLCQSLYFCSCECISQVCFSLLHVFVAEGTFFWNFCSSHGIVM